ncbi:hypothetical protein IMZ48_14420 [Candidatus Bathyarchaeota archaeon]|nr:hypothetical protein [Candidatus Bathyarchaeota archaeon]
MLSMLKRDKSERTPGRRYVRAKAAGKRRPEELSYALLFALQSEAFELAFPYLHFHRVCWGMLSAVSDSCRQDLLRSIGPGYLDKECKLPFVVGYILMQASGALGPRKLTNFVAAAKVIDEELGKGVGDSMLSVLRKEKGIPISFVHED